jgi:two-component system, sensor histidine kinase LadS
LPTLGKPTMPHFKLMTVSDKNALAAGRGAAAHKTRQCSGRRLNAAAGQAAQALAGVCARVLGVCVARAWVFVAAWLIGGAVWAQPATDSSATTAWLDIDSLTREGKALALPQALWLEDASGTMDIEAVAQSGGFRGGFDPAQQFRGAGVIWLRWDLRGSENQNLELDLVVPTIDLAQMYWKTPDGGWYRQVAGDSIPNMRWTRPNHHPHFTLPTLGGERQTATVFLRLQSESAVYLDARFWRQDDLAHEERLEFALVGIFLGGLAVLVSTAFVHALQFRDRWHMSFAAVAALQMVAILAYLGIGSLFLWSNSPKWADMSPGFMLTIAAGPSLYFVASLLMGHERNRAFSLIRVMSMASPVAAVAFALLPRSPAQLVLFAYVLSCLFAGMGLCVWGMKRRLAIAPWLLGAYLPVCAVLALIILRQAGVWGVSWIGPTALAVALALHLPFGFTALMIRTRERHAEMVRIQASSRKDALTGLNNPVIFHEHCIQALRNYQRVGRHATIFFVELRNAKRVEQAHGQAIVDRCLLRTVLKLRQLISDDDALGRVSEHRFGIILDGVGLRAVAMERMSRLIAAGLMPLRGLRPEVTLQFHCAGLVIAERPLGADQMRDVLNQQLDQMSSRTRRPIRFVEPPSTLLMPSEPADSSLSQPASTDPAPIATAHAALPNQNA